ncbi:MAG: sigma-70 family RNA polymerase sigma factor [Phycisphaerales bacterium]|nr:sigma-70 family RNA polymerase sigma factor [Phycisphaerales bacterium]
MVGADMVAREPSPAPDALGRTASDPLAALIAAHEPRVRRLAFRLLGWQGDVDDVVQDVFVAAWQKAPEGDEDRTAAWLARVTINACRARMRRKRLWMSWFSGASDERRIVAPSSTETEREEAFEPVRQAIRKLKPQDREVIVLRYLEEMRVTDIAALLGVANNTVEARLSRARRRMRDQLGSMEAAL